MNPKDYSEFGVVIIESLKEGEMKTGTLLYEGTLNEIKGQEPHLTVLLHQVNSKEDFFKAMDEVIESAEKGRMFPIVHFETHGSEDGIYLSSNELVGWDELFVKTRILNIILQNSLVLYMGMCFGVTQIKNIDPSKKAPFLKIVATTRKISADDLFKSFIAFYKNFFFSFDLAESVEKMNSIGTKGKAAFCCISSKSCFEAILDPDWDPENFKRTVIWRTVLAIARNPQLLKYSFEDNRIMVETNIRTILAEARKKKNFFMMNEQ